MIARRTLLTGGGAAMVPGLGRSNPSRFPYIGRPKQPGVGAPSQGQTIRARYVIVFGDNDGVFIYDGTPAPGNPPVAWASSGTKDPYNNTLPANDIVSYNPVSGAVSQLSSGQVNLGSSAQFTGVSGSGPAALTVISGGGPGSGSMLSLASGTDSNTDTPMLFYLLSQDASGANTPTAQLLGPLQLASQAAPPPVGLGQYLWTNNNGTPSVQTFAGQNGQLPVTLTDITTKSNSNNTSPEAITAAYSIPENDLNTGTKYTLEVPVTGTWEGQVLNVGAYIDGTFTNLVPLISTAFTTGHGFAGTIRLKLTCTATGAGGTCNLDMDGTMDDSNVDRGPSTSLTLNAHRSALALATDAFHTFAIAAEWGAAGAGQIINGITSECVRIGP